jgi:hypothetical protein
VNTNFNKKTGNLSGFFIDLHRFSSGHLRQIPKESLAQKNSAVFGKKGFDGCRNPA